MTYWSRNIFSYDRKKIKYGFLTKEFIALKLILLFSKLRSITSTHLSNQITYFNILKLVLFILKVLNNSYALKWLLCSKWCFITFELILFFSKLYGQILTLYCDSSTKHTGINLKNMHFIEQSFPWKYFYSSHKQAKDSQKYSWIKISTF
jgi:hypothetical protein